VNMGFNDAFKIKDDLYDEREINGDFLLNDLNGIFKKFKIS